MRLLALVANRTAVDQSRFTPISPGRENGFTGCAHLVAHVYAHTVFAVRANPIQRHPLVQGLTGRHSR